MPKTMPSRKKDQDFWVFGYGSLLWNPGFEFVERRLAALHGFNRSFCMASIHYRGTEEAPGEPKPGVAAIETLLVVDARQFCSTSFSSPGFGAGSDGPLREPQIFDQRK